MGIGLWLAFTLTSRELPAGGSAWPALVKALLPASIVLYWMGAASHLWPFTQVGLIAAGVVSAEPLFLMVARSAFGALDPSYGKAARSLGASEWRVFARVQLPLAFRPVLAGAASVFLGVFGELILVWWFTKRIFS